MTAFLIRTAISAVGLLFIANLINGIDVENYTSALIVAVVLGLANATVKPILQAVASGMTCVLSCVTLGLWSLLLSWLINALLFYGAGALLDGFDVKGFAPAMWGALALSIINALATALTSDKKKDRE
jgi:putative membrane protein